MVLEPKEITSCIYQGSWPQARHIPELVQLGITDILNLDSPYEDPLPFLEADIMLHHLFIRDASLMTPQLVRDAIAIIDRSISAHSRKIYIHCNEGVSRSPTIVWLYLIHKGISPEDAAVKVKPNKLLYDSATVEGLISHRR